MADQDTNQKDQSGQTPNPDTPTGQTGGQQAQQGQQQGKTFTEADLERILKDRLTRAEESTTKKLLEKLGIDNLDNLEATVKAEKQRSESEKSELQKALDKLADADKKIKDTEERANKLAQDMIVKERNSEIKEALRGERATKPDAVLILMAASKPEMVEAVADKEGKINKDALKALVDAAKKEHAEYFVGKGPGSPSNNQGRVPERDSKIREKADAQLKRKVRRSL